MSMQIYRPAQPLCVWFKWHLYGVSSCHAASTAYSGWSGYYSGFKL